MSLVLRPLSAQERSALFKTYQPNYDPIIYLDAVRDMEGGVAYAIPVNGVSVRATKIRLSKAAKTLGLKIRFGLKSDKEIYVELS